MKNIFLSRFTVKSRSNAIFLCCGISLLLASCGGNSSNSAVAPVSTADFTLSANVTAVEAGSDEVKLALKTNGDLGEFTWRIEGNVGNLSANNGSTVSFIPPPFGSVESLSLVKIIATAGSVSRELTLQVKPNTNGLYSFVGLIGGSGNLDGVGADVRFNFPLEIVADENDLLYVLDKRNGLIRRVSGDKKVETFAEYRDFAAIQDPWYAYRYMSGHLRFSPSSNVPQLVRADGTTKNINKDEAVPNFANYRDIDGNMFDLGNYEGKRQVIYKNRELLAGAFSAADAQIDGVGNQARFNHIDSILVYPDQQIYLLDRVLGSANLVLRKVKPDGAVSTIDSLKFDSTARLIPNSGALPLVLDGGGIHSLLADGRWRTVAIEGAQLIPTKNTTFLAPDATADRQGNIFITDPIRNVIVKISAQGLVTNFAGMSGNKLGESNDGIGTQAILSAPRAIASDTDGNLYVIETRASNRQDSGYLNDPTGLSLRKVTRDGRVTTLAAPGKWWGKSDSAYLAEQFTFPTSITVDANGKLYIADRPAFYGGSISQSPSLIGKASLHSVSKDGVLAKIEAPFLNEHRFDTVLKYLDSKRSLYVLNDSGIYQGLDNGSFSSILAKANITSFAFDSAGNLIYADDFGIYKQAGLSSFTKLSSARANTLAVDGKNVIYFAVGCELRAISADGVETRLAGKQTECGNRLGSLNDARFASISAILPAAGQLLYVVSGNAILRLVK